MIDQDSNDFDGDVDEAGNGKGVVTTRNDAGEVLCVTEVMGGVAYSYLPLKILSAQ